MLKACLLLSEDLHVAFFWCPSYDERACSSLWIKRSKITINWETVMGKLNTLTSILSLPISSVLVLRGYCDSLTSRV